jgi:Uma2 family endonuclease
MLRRPWTVADLEELPDDGNRYEVVDGQLLVTPSPSLRHQHAAFELAVLLREYLRREPVGQVVIAPAEIVFSESRADARSGSTRSSIFCWRSRCCHPQRRAPTV